MLFVQLGRGVPRRAQLRGLLPLPPAPALRNLPTGGGTARCCTRCAGLARHWLSPHLLCGTGTAQLAIGVQGWHGMAPRYPACRAGTRRARLAQCSTARRGTSTQAGTAQHRGTSVRDWHGAAGSRAAPQGCAAHPAAPGPAQGHSWPPLGLSGSSQRHDRPPLGTSSFRCIHPPRTPPFTKTYVTSSLIAQRSTEHPYKCTLLRSGNVHFPLHPHRGPRDPSPFPIHHAPPSPHAYKPPPRLPALLVPFVCPQK